MKRHLVTFIAVVVGVMGVDQLQHTYLHQDTQSVLFLSYVVVCWIISVLTYREEPTDTPYIVIRMRPRKPAQVLSPCCKAAIFREQQGRHVIGRCDACHKAVCRQHPFDQCEEWLDGASIETTASLRLINAEHRVLSLQ